MNLQMFVNDKLIGSIPIDTTLSNNHQYIHQKKKELEEKFREKIQLSGSEPSYAFEASPTTERRRVKK